MAGTPSRKTLQAAFASLGFQDVSTHKQSGNVILETNSADAESIRTKVEAKLRIELGYDVATFVRTIPQLKKIIDSEPFTAQPEEGASYLVTFLASTQTEFPLKLPLTIPKSTDK